MVIDRLTKLFRSIRHNDTDIIQIDPEKYHFTAHRGLSARFPENTVQAFKAAASEKFAAIETDIWEVPDFFDRGYDDLGFVIMHNEDLSGMCGVKLPIGSLSCSVIGEYPITGGQGNRNDTRYLIPTLDDFLDVMKTNDKELIIEIKDENISHEGASKLIRLLDDEGLAHRTVFGSFHKRSLVTLQSIAGEEYRFQRFIGARDKGNVEKEITWCAENGIDIISIKTSLLTKKTLRSIRSKGMQVEVWVVNDRTEAVELLKRGVDRITTNDVLW